MFRCVKERKPFPRFCLNIRKGLYMFTVILVSISLVPLSGWPQDEKKTTKIRLAQQWAYLQKCFNPDFDFWVQFWSVSMSNFRCSGWLCPTYLLYRWPAFWVCWSYFVKHVLRILWWAASQNVGYEWWELFVATRNKLKNYNNIVIILLNRMIWMILLYKMKALPCRKTG